MQALLQRINHFESNLKISYWPVLFPDAEFEKRARPCDLEMIYDTVALIHATTKHRRQMTGDEPPGTLLRASNEGVRFWVDPCLCDKAEPVSYYDIFVIGPPNWEFSGDDFSDVFGSKPSMFVGSHCKMYWDWKLMTQVYQARVLSTTAVAQFTDKTVVTYTRRHYPLSVAYVPPEGIPMRRPLNGSGTANSPLRSPSNKRARTGEKKDVKEE